MARDHRTTARLIHTLGATSLLAVATEVAISIFVAATQPSLGPEAPKHGWFHDLAHRLSFLPALLTDALHGAGPLATGAGFVAGYCAPLLVSTLCSVVLLSVLLRRRDELSDDDARRALGWAIAFGIVAVPAFNVLTQDIWLSVAWGRMSNQGMNPFASPYPIELAADLPLEYDPMPTTYGPFWALVCSFAVAVSSGAPIVAWLVLKLVLASAWVACLWTVSEIARPFGAWRRTLAIAVVGWSPIGMHCGVAEGHNDVLMVAAALLWSRFMQRASAAGPLLLTVSILTKYVTAPLALVDLVHHWRARTMSAKRYGVRILPGLLLLLAGAVFLALAMGGLSQTSAMRDWKFLDPADALRLLARYTGLPAGPLGVPIVAAVFGSTALIELTRLARAPTMDNALRAQLAIMAAVLLAGTGHVWPWFFVWCLPYAALALDFWLSWFVIGAASVAPFTIVHWWRFGAQGALRSEWPSLIMYGIAAALTAAYFYRAGVGAPQSSGARTSSR